MDSIRVFSTFKFGFKCVALWQTTFGGVTNRVGAKARRSVVERDPHRERIERALGGAIELHEGVTSVWIGEHVRSENDGKRNEQALFHYARGIRREVLPTPFVIEARKRGKPIDSTIGQKRCQSNPRRAERRQSPDLTRHGAVNAPRTNRRTHVLPLAAARRILCGKIKSQISPRRTRSSLRNATQHRYCLTSCR